jgi:hypothetical protein
MTVHLEGEAARFTVQRGGELGSIPSEPPPHRCKCGRGPWRKGQRNCVLCNREANGKYRKSLKYNINVLYMHK